MRVFEIREVVRVVLHISLLPPWESGAPHLRSLLPRTYVIEVGATGAGFARAATLWTVVTRRTLLPGGQRSRALLTHVPLLERKVTYNHTQITHKSHTNHTQTHVPGRGYSWRNHRYPGRCLPRRESPASCPPHSTWPGCT